MFYKCFIFLKQNVFYFFLLILWRNMTPQSHKTETNKQKNYEM